MRDRFYSRQRGQTAVLMISMMAIAVMAGLSAYIPATQRGYSSLQSQRANSYQDFAASMAAQSAIPVLVSALKRRLFTPPLDKNCNAQEYFSVDIAMDGGIQTNVTGFYDSTQQVYQILSRAWYTGDTEARVGYVQVFKIVNAANMMFVSTSPSPVTLYSGASRGSVGALIAGSRRLYFGGQLNLCPRADQFTVNFQRNVRDNWVPGERDLNENFATIIQAERVYAMGGLGYIHRGSSEPNPNGSSASDPYFTTTEYWRQNHSNYLGESCGGGAVITSSFEFANAHKNRVQSLTQLFSSSAGASTIKDQLYRQVYPKALFSNGPSVGPMLASNGIDNGTFMGNPERWLWFDMSYGGSNNFGNSLDLTCLQSAGLPTTLDPKKSCSRNSDWPNGFAAWKSQANLNGVLLTNTDSETVRFFELNWDNMEALKEDAQQCGLVVDASSTAGEFYEDCNLASPEMWEAYRLNPGQNPCRRTRKIDFDTITGTSGLKLNKYITTNYTNPALESKLVRRVIYSTTDLEITQNHINGLIPTIANSDHRRKLMLWVVNEKATKLRTYQNPNLPNGLPDPGTILDPSFKRTVYFNESANGLQPLPIVMLSPDPVEILSPQFVPVDYPTLQDDFPVVANFIKPKVHLATYHRINQNDGYKWGARNINISNIAFITGVGRSPNFTDPNMQIFARGMWASPRDPSGRVDITNSCMMSLAGSPWGRRTGDNDFVENPFPVNPSTRDVADPNLWSVPNTPPTAAEIAAGTFADGSPLAARGSAFWANGSDAACASGDASNRVGCVNRTLAAALTPNLEQEDGTNLPPRGSYFYTNFNDPACKNYETPVDATDHVGALPGSTPGNRKGCLTQAGYPAVFSVQTGSNTSQINLKGLRMFLTFVDCQEGAPNCNRPSGKRRLDVPETTYSDARNVRSSQTSNDGASAPFDLSDRRFIWTGAYYFSTAASPDHPRARCMPSQVGLYANPAALGNNFWMYTNKNAEAIVQIVPGSDLNNLGAIGTQPTQALQTVGHLPAGRILDSTGAPNEKGPGGGVIVDDDDTVGGNAASGDGSGGLSQWLNDVSRVTFQTADPIAQ